MDKKLINQFFKDRPSIPLLSISREANISSTLLRNIMSGKSRLTEKTKNKLLPVFKRYGYINMSEDLQDALSSLYDQFNDRVNNREDLDVCSWPLEKGVLLTPNEAKQILVSTKWHEVINQTN